MGFRRGFLRRYGASLALALNAGLALAYAGLWLLTLARGLNWRADFTAYYTGWTLIRSGRAAELYNLEAQRAVQAALLGPNRFKDDLLPHNTVPHVAWITSPLGALPMRAAYLVWTGLNALLLMGLSLAWWRALSDRSRRERVLALTAALAFPPLLSTFMLGTSGVAVAAVWWGMYRAARREDDAVLGAMLALLSARPQTGVLPALALLGTRRWRAWGIGALLLALWLGATTWALGPRVWLDYLHLLRADSAAYGHLGIYPETMYNLRGTLTLWLGYARAPWIEALTWVGFGLAGLGIVALWWRPPQRGTPAWTLRWALTLGLTLFFSPHLNPQDGWLMVVPTLLIDEALHGLQRPRGWWAGLVLSAPLACLAGEFVLGGALGIRVPTLVLIGLTGYAGYLARSVSSLMGQADVRP